MPNFLTVQIEFSDNYGNWIDFSNSATYKVAKGTLEASAVTFRRDEVTNAFIEGKFTVNALRDNITEAIVIYVYGNTIAGLKSAIDTLTSTISQTNFSARITLENSQRLWECWASDYTVTITNELYHNRQATVNIQLQRLPGETVTTV